MSLRRSDDTIKYYQLLDIRVAIIFIKFKLIIITFYIFISSNLKLNNCYLICSRLPHDKSLKDS